MAADSDHVLGLFVKWPLGGEVKTRLAAKTSPHFAVDVAMALLADSLDRYSKIDARRVLGFSPAKHRLEFGRLAGDRWELIPQSEGDLGERMADFFSARFAKGAKRVVLLGADSPTLPLGFVSQAFGLLAEADLVIGPATDGGYYLIGMTSLIPSLFHSISWGGPNVLKQSIDRLTGTSARLALLPPWYDVDTLADWHMIQGHIIALRMAGVDSLAPRTEELAAGKIA